MPTSPMPKDTSNRSNAFSSASTPAETRDAALYANCRAREFNASPHAILEGIDSVPQLSLNDLMELVLPPVLSLDQEEAVLADLKYNCAILNDKWSAFNPNPSTLLESDPTYFQYHLPQLAQNVVISAGRVVGQNLIPVDKATELKVAGPTTSFSKKTITSRPDIYYVVRGTSGDTWDDIAIPIQVRRKSRTSDVNKVS